jgi:hypothetical protein
MGGSPGNLINIAMAPRRKPPRASLSSERLVNRSPSSTLTRILAMRITPRILVASCCLPMLATSLATAEIIDFEDVATPVNTELFDAGGVSNGYRGFNWSTNWVGSSLLPAGSAAVYHNVGSTASGYLTAIASGTRAMFLPGVFESPVNELTITRSETWNFGSMDFAAAWNTNLSVEITGLLAGNVLYTYSTTIATPGQLASLELNFNGIDTLFIRSSGGTTAYAGGSGAHLIIDNFAYTVPAPSAMALLAAAGFCRRRRR